MKIRSIKSLRYRDNQRGATLMVVLVIMVILGLTAGISGKTWKTVMQKAKEEELLFVGNQYRRAIEGYYTKGHGGRAGIYPSQIDYLLKDPRSLQTLRHIRRIYPDPMTGGDWMLIKDEGGRIKGVYSSSSLEPFKKDGFTKEYESFKDASAYSDWKFVYEPKKDERGVKTQQASQNETTNQAPPQ